jgi:lipopolysaccharide export system permease protein
MTVCEMQAAQDKARRDFQTARKEFLGGRAELQKKKAKLSEAVIDAKTSPPWDVGLGRLYCNAIALFLPKKAHAQGVRSGPRLRLPEGASSTPAVLPSVSPEQLGTPDAAKFDSLMYKGPTPTATQLAMIEGTRMKLEDSANLMNSYGVEIHKKFALAVACFVFVLLGAPIALRFPRGGVGLTIGVSLFVFALYYVCLIAGESIAKRGLMPAVVSMWMANVIFALIALWMLAKMGQEGSTARGGDMKEMWGALGGWTRSKIGWKDRRVRRERLAA